MKLSHTDENGKAEMVDVGNKEITVRTASAEGFVKMKPETLTAIRDNTIKKGDVLSASRIAGIMAAKKTNELIPLCHTIPIDKVQVDFEFVNETTLKITAFAKCEYKTGIEMEALTAVSVSALTVYDMCKAIDRQMEITSVRLVSKSGGKSGDYNRY